MKFLKRLLPSHDVEALIGDIVEESRHRSRLWYWGQLLAVLVCSWRDVRRHPRLALRATGVGFATLAAFGITLGIAFRVLDVLTNGGYYVFGYWVTLPDIWPIDYTASLFLSLGINALSFALAGWAIARTDRSQGLAMVLPFLALVTPVPIAVALIRTFVTRTDYYFFFANHMLPTAVLILSPPASILLGGILGARRA